MSIKYAIKDTIAWESALLNLQILLEDYFEYDNDDEGIIYLLIKLNEKTTRILAEFLNNHEEYIKEHKVDDENEIDIHCLWGMVDEKFDLNILYNAKENKFFIDE